MTGEASRLPDPVVTRLVTGRQFLNREYLAPRFWTNGNPLGDGIPLQLRHRIIVQSFLAKSYSMGRL